VLPKLGRPVAHGRKKLFRKERDTLAAVLAELEGKEKYDLIQNNARSNYRITDSR
jgi:hypothetical protein